MGKLGSYASLLYAANQADSARAKFYGDVSDKLTQVSTDLIFFELELNQIDDEALAAALTHPDLARYKPWFEDLRKEKPYQLEERIEKVFHEKGQTSRGAFSRLFNETMSALKFPVAGEPAPLGLEAHAEPPLRSRRAATAGGGRGAKLRAQGQPAPLYAHHQHARQGQGDLRPLARLSRRGGEPPSREQGRGARRRGARFCGARGLSAPLAPLLCDEGTLARHGAALALGPQRTAPGEAGADLLVAGRARAWCSRPTAPSRPTWRQSPRSFSIETGSTRRCAKGKAQGAFSAATVPSVHPYVLMNYQGKPRDVMTLAHELGHGVHQMLARAQGPLLAPTPLTLAETASVFGEMLTFKALLAETADPRERKAMIAGKVEDMLNTVVRQIAFYTFERKVHEGRRQGELTSDTLNQFWLEVQSESLGPAIDLKPGYEVFWTYIPHFINSPFYVYAYAFGDCLVNSLYGLYQEAHPGFVAKYFEMLKAGGSKHHSELLAPFGLDASDPAFWGKGLRVIEGMIDELEAMEKVS